MFLIMAAAVACAGHAVSGWAIEVNTAQGLGMDGEVTENRNIDTNEVAYGFNGTKVNMNARYNGYNGGLEPGSTAEGSDSDNDDRNEFWLMRFDLSGEANKSQITNAALKLTGYRTSNLQKDLRIWGVNSGTTGLDTITDSSLFADLPGFVQDFDITTTSVDPAVTTYLGDFLFPNHQPGDLVPSEGDFLTISQDVLDNTGPNGTSEPAGAGVSPQSTLDAFLRSLGPTDMALFIVGGVASNGQVRIATKEATATETGLVDCTVEVCAPILSYDLSEGIAGDFDGDTDVDGRDFLTWQRNPAVGDLNDWQTNYGTDGGLSATASVPEPGTALLSLAVGALLLTRRHHCANH
jgi:hypothetical protein